MDNNINFVSGVNLNLEKQVKRLKYLKITAITSLLIVGLVAIIFFAITFFLPISSVKNEQTQALQGISQLHKKLVSYDLASQRLKDIKIIMNKRKSYPFTVKTILDKLPADLTAKSLSVQQGVLDITINGQSLLSLNQFIDDFKDLVDKSKNMLNITVQNLQYNSLNSNYTLTFQVSIL